MNLQSKSVQKTGCTEQYLHKLRTSAEGVFFSVETQTKHRKFVEAIKPEKIFLKADDTERIAAENKNDPLLEIPKQVMTSTTMNDDKTELWTVQREADLIHQVRPAQHICCDRAVYETDRANMRRWLIRKYLDDVRRLRGKTEDTETQLLPLAKGTNDEEIEIMLNGLRRLGFNRCAIYCPQYFLKGNYFHELRRKAHKIAQAEVIEEIVLIGLQSPNYIRKMPKEVVAATGQRWRRQIELDDGVVTRRDVVKWQHSVEAALNENQTRISEWVDNNGRR